MHCSDELGYSPNLMARSLANKRSFTLGAVVPEIVTSHHSYVINGFYNVARPRGYHVLVMVSNESENIEQHILYYYSSLPVDGILISVTEETTDDELSAFKVIDHLVSVGRRNIAFIGPHDVLGTTKNIYKGYIKEKKKLDLPHSEELVQVKQ